MPPKHIAPDRQAIEAMEPFERLGLDQIHWIAEAGQADEAWNHLSQESVLGFDTESRPTFVRHQSSDGPHVVQLATRSAAYVFSLRDAHCTRTIANLLAKAEILKVGFGLGDDHKRIVAKLRIEPAGVIDLNQIFHQRGWRRDIGVKAAVAVTYGRRFIKSKKAATSNWSTPRLSDAQLIYAANDAWAALRVYEALAKTD
jgi:ribonuclease D